MNSELIERLEGINQWIEMYETNPDYITIKAEQKRLQAAINQSSDKSSALARESKLYDALKVTSDTNYFTVAERIYINQERGYLLSINTYNELRCYQIPQEIEKKINDLKL